MRRQLNQGVTVIVVVGVQWMGLIITTPWIRATPVRVSGTRPGVISSQTHCLGQRVVCKGTGMTYHWAEQTSSSIEVLLSTWTGGHIQRKDAEEHTKDFFYSFTRNSIEISNYAVTQDLRLHFIRGTDFYSSPTSGLFSQPPTQVIACPFTGFYPSLALCISNAVKSDCGWSK